MNCIHFEKVLLHLVIFRLVLKIITQKSDKKQATHARVLQPNLRHGWHLFIILCILYQVTIYPSTMYNTAQIYYIRHSYYHLHTPKNLRYWFPDLCRHYSRPSLFLHNTWHIPHRLNRMNLY
jgi:hypothetical protein